MRRIFSFLMAGTFLDCSRVVSVAKKSEKKKGKNKKRKGYKINEENGKRLLDVISSSAGMMISKYASADRLSKRIRDTASSIVMRMGMTLEC